MREVTFIRKNQERWKAFEEIVNKPDACNAQEMAGAYVQLMDDLAFARAQFPGSQTLLYLNAMSRKVHEAISRNQRLRQHRLRQVCFYEVPKAMYEVRPHLLISTVVFVLGCTLGFVAGSQNEDLARSILGDFYVDMTIANIKSGETLAVYGRTDPVEMLFYIALNNIMILLRSVGLGLIPVVGAAYLLIPNAVMVGCFHGLFAQYNQLATATLGIWIHGTLELSSIVVGGAAAIRVTHAVLHPGTYPRREAFIRGIRTATLVALGMVPLLFLAAVLESFVTRLYGLSPLLNAGIIVGSAALVIWYVVVLPRTIINRSVNGDRRVSA